MPVVASANVDGTDFVEATRDLDPAETLFIISSKTFTMSAERVERLSKAFRYSSKQHRWRRIETSWRGRCNT
jgi:glucose-6-phosphate isomerase